MARDRLKEAIAKLGPRLAEAQKRLEAGESKQKVGKAMGIHPRWLSDLNPILNLPGANLPAPEAALTGSERSRSTMETARRLIDSQMPLQQRIGKLVKLARSKDERVSANALQRLDDLGGIIASKTPVEPDPPPLFKLPEHSMPALERYESWVKTRQKELDAATTPVPPRTVH